MSVQAIVHVLENSKQSGTSLLVLLAIANRADERGRDAWPSVATVAKMARTSERHVRRLLPVLVKAGELAVKRGAGTHGVNLYTITGVGGQQLPLPMTPDAQVTPDISSPLTKRAGRGDAQVRGGMTPRSPNTSLRPDTSISPRGASAPEGEDRPNDASDVVAAYAAARSAKGLPPCDAPGRAILGQHAKAYLAGPKDPRITTAAWYDPERERARRVAAAVTAATRAGDQGRNPGFLADWLREQQEIVAREHHAEHGRGHRPGSGELRPIARAI